MVDVTDAILGVEDYFDIEKKWLDKDEDWFELLVDCVYGDQHILRDAYIEWKLGNDRNAGHVLIKCLNDYLMKKAQEQYEIHELGVEDDH